MIPCLILGDSLAVGVAQARPECAVIAEVGINSGRYLQTLHATRHARTVVISLGVNDSRDIETGQNLRRLRHGISADTVYWLVPGIHPAARDAVQEIAKAFRDRVIDVAPLAGADHIHPDRTGYAKLASLTRQGGRPPASAYNAFQARNLAYNDFGARDVPGIKIWRGPYEMNGLPVPPTPPPPPKVAR